jgi:two-component sensor histidine kinase
MKKTLCCTSLLCWFLTSNAQSLTRHQADSLLKLVPELNASVNGAGTVLRLADYYLKKGSSLKSDLDSAAYFIREARELNPRFGSPWADGYILLLEGRLADERGQKNAGMSLVAKAVQRLKSTEDTILYGKACYELSRYYTDLHNENQLAIRVSLVEKAVSLLRQSSDRIELGADMQMLGDLYLQQGKWTKSIEVLQLTLDVFKSIHDKKVQGVYVLMSTDEIYLGNYQQAITYGLLAITINEEAHESGMQLCQIENVVGSCYSHLHDYLTAIQYKNKALAIAIKYRDTSAIYMITEDVCVTYLKVRQPGKTISLLNEILTKYPKNVDFYYIYNYKLIYLHAYVDLKNFKKAAPFYAYARTLVNNAKVPDENRDAVFIMLESYESALSNFHEAYGNLKFYARYVEKYHNNIKREHSYEVHAQLDSLTHNYKSAYFYTIRYKKLSDSLLNASKNKQIQELEVIYKTKEKDNSIEMLHQKANLQDAELGKSRRTTNETIAGICVLLVSGGFFVRHYNIRQRAFRIIGKQHAVITTKNEEILLKNKKLESLIQEKEYLLIEVHHRVKNNLHTVMSFLSLQSKYLKGEALAAIKISRQRIYAMSLIHQKLYMADDIKTIDMKSYLEEFVSYFLDSFSPDMPIKFLTDIESIRLPVNKAIPVGLIINEAITNSAKYAFAGSKEPKITLSFRLKEDQIELIIKDNGVGIPGDVNQATYNSLGIKLIKGLCNDLDGTLCFASVTGTSITIIFQP